MKIDLCNSGHGVSCVKLGAINAAVSCYQRFMLCADVNKRAAVVLFMFS